MGSDDDLSAPAEVDAHRASISVATDAMLAL